MIALRKRTSTTIRDSGSALVMVIAIGMVLIIMVAGAMTFAMSGLKKSGGDADSNAALAAAMAGVDEYRSRLAADGSYYQFGNPGSLFTIATSSDVVLPDASNVNPAFGVDNAWAQLSPGSRASFRYEVDNFKYPDYGVLRIRSTGRVGESVRSVVANIKAKGFLDYMYFTDYEVQDPELLSASDRANCLATFKHAWEPGPARSGCAEIAFGGGDVVDGKVHSNDTIRICDAQFLATVTTAKPTAAFYSAKNSNGNNCSGQDFQGGVPSPDSTVLMPSKNTQMLKDTQINEPRDVPRPGCLYTGPTTITLNSNGSMTVFSPWTKFTHSGPTTPAAGVIITDCGTAGPAGLGAAGGQTLPIPNNNLIYIQDISSITTDPNYWSSTSFPTVGGTTLSCANGSNGVGYPVTTGGRTEKPASAYDCRVGDLFLKGTLKGRLTLATSSKIFLVDNVTYAGGTATKTDMLGLVSNKATFVWNPVDTNGNLMFTSSNRTIHAAILSVENTFQVQNFATGPRRGTLSVFGSISQKYRGIVSQTGGYVKNYIYDKNLKLTAPPKFLNPVSTTYGTTSMADVSAAYKPDGSPIALP